MGRRLASVAMPSTPTSVAWRRTPVVRSKAGAPPSTGTSSAHTSRDARAATAPPTPRSDPNGQTAQASFVNAGAAEVRIHSSMARSQYRLALYDAQGLLTE